MQFGVILRCNFNGEFHIISASASSIIFPCAASEMTVEIKVDLEGTRAPQLPYVETLSYPPTTETNDDDQTEDKNSVSWSRKCSPELPNSEGMSLYPLSMLSLQLPLRSNSICSECSIVRSPSAPVRSPSAPLRQKNQNHSCSFKNVCNSCSQINKLEEQVTSSSHKHLRLNQNCSVSSNKLSSSSVSCQSFRPYSPQPGPSGYNGTRGKGRALSNSAVKFNNRQGIYKTVTASDSSDNIYSTNCTTSINDVEEERDNTAADRGTLYCACGILISIVVLVLLLVNFA